MDPTWAGAGNATRKLWNPGFGGGWTGPGTGWTLGRETGRVRSCGPIQSGACSAGLTLTQAQASLCAGSDNENPNPRSLLSSTIDKGASRQSFFSYLHTAVCMPRQSGFYRAVHAQPTHTTQPALPGPHVNSSGPLPRCLDLRSNGNENERRTVDRLDRPRHSR